MTTPKQQRIFIIGGSGYIGSRIVAFAIEEGYSIRGLSRSESSDEKLKALGAIAVRGDLTSFHVITRESAAADLVIHLADSWTGSNDYDEVIKTDAGVVDAIAEGLKGTDKLLIITSGTAVVSPDPNGGETDEEAPFREDFINRRYVCEGHALGLRAEGIRVCSIRLAPYVYGMGGSGVRLFMSMYAGAGEIVRVGEGKNRVSAVHVDDAARLYLLAAKKAKGGDIFNVSSTTDVSIGQITDAMAAILEMPVNPLTTEEIRAKYGPLVAGFMTMEDRASSAKANRVLDWQPREIGILEDIRTGSYPPVAKALREKSA